MTEVIDSQEKLSEWVRKQFQRANKYLSEHGVLFDTVVAEESRYLAPLVAVWKIKSLDKQFYWVICGELPTDFVAFDNAPTARQALKHFSLKWQLKAENLLMNEKETIQQDVARKLIDSAEKIYQLQADEKLWGEA